MYQTFPTEPALQRVLAECAEVGAALWEKGWAERNAGNLSVDISALAARLPAAPEPLPRQPLPRAYAELAGRTFLVTGTGRRMRDLARRPAENLDIIRIVADGAAYETLWRDAGVGRPTSELNSHLGLRQYLRQRGAPQQAILHTHPTELLALTHLPAYMDEAALNRLLWAMHPETKIVLPEGVALVSYQRPGSAELEAATLRAIGQRRVLLWEKHGCVAVGADVGEAFDLIDTLNKSAQVFFACHMAGATPAGLTPAQVDELERYFCRRERPA